MRKEYELTEAQLAMLLEASKPTPVMYLTGGTLMGGTPQENANAAWARMGAELGFDPMSVRPIVGRGQRFFSAEEVEI